MKLLEYITHQTRKWAERNNKDFPEDLCGMCAIASAELFMRLKKRGFHPKLVINKDESHCFVICDGNQLDITATQFNKQKVLIKKRIYGEPWIKGKIYDNIDDFNEAISDWPGEQQYSFHRNTTLKKIRK